MVDEQMARDLLSFRKPILVLGDPGQLPPIQGQSAFTRDAPDALLTEIHRQAAESAIIRLATMARRGEPSGSAEATTAMCGKDKPACDARAGTRAGQVYPRQQRHPPATEQRAAPRGVAGRRLPAGPGVKNIICFLKNENVSGLINGMFITLMRCLMRTAATSRQR